MKYLPPVIMVLLAVCLVGCNSQGGDISPVKATVVYDGNPVTEGTITFVPSEGGKPGSGTINSDGTVTWTSYTEGDGLNKGPGKLSFTPPPIDIPENLKPGDSLPKHKLDGLSPKDPSITIEDGTNEITIELVK